MANISKITLPDGNTYDIKDANAYQKPSDGIPASDLASGVIPSAPSAASVPYDNTQSGLTADDVQEAIDELAAGGSTSGKADQITIASVEASTTATEAHPLGSIFYFNGVLYRALADIAIGDTINTGSGGNATQTTVAENFSRIVKLTSAQYAQLSAAEKAADIVYIVTDDPIPEISTSTPQMDGTGAAGSTGEVSDAGHTHPSDTSRVPVNGMGKNLLRNWYFVGGGTGRGIFPVNQRGLSSYSTVDPSTVDGWALQAGSISPISAGLQLSSDTRIAQAISSGRALLQNKTITFSVLIASISGNCRVRIASSTGSTYNNTTIIASEYVSASGILSLTCTLGEITSNRNFNFIIESDSGSTVVIAATKLELGSQQTLCHQENGTWVLNEIPDYEYELYCCMTSTADTSDTYANKSLANEQELATAESGTTASNNFAEGDLFTLNGAFCRAKTAISSGAAFTLNTNYEETTVAKQFRSTKMFYLSQESGTTSSLGNLNLALNPNAIVVGFRPSQSQAVSFFGRGSNGNYFAHMVNSSGSNITNTAVTLDVYYILP